MHIRAFGIRATIVLRDESLLKSVPRRKKQGNSCSTDNEDKQSDSDW